MIEKEIKEVNEELEYNRRLQQKYPDKEGLKVNESTLKYVHNQLLERRERLAQKMKLEEFTITLEGEIIQSNRVPVTLLSRIMDRIQNLIFRIARSKKKGPAAKGEIPLKIKEAAMLDVTTFNPGSFKITLSNHIFSTGNSTLEPTLSKKSFDSLKELINCEDDIKKIQIQWESLGDSVIQEYKSLIRNIYVNKLNVTFQDNENSKRISKELAKNVYDVLKKADTKKPDEMDYIGILRMVDLDKHKFGFTIFDGEKESRIDGKFSEDIKGTIKTHLDKSTKASFLRKRKYIEAKDDYIYTWELIGFNDKN